MTTWTEWRTPGKIGDAYMLCPKWFLLWVQSDGTDNAYVRNNVVTFRVRDEDGPTNQRLNYGIGALIEDIDCYELHRLEA